MARVTYVCLRDGDITLTPSHDPFKFIPPANTVVDRSSSNPILMFLVRANGGSEATGGVPLKLQVEFNGHRLFSPDGREIVAQTAARSYHEIMNRLHLRPGVENTLQFTAVDGNNKVQIVISDVIVWFQEADIL